LLPRPEAMEVPLLLIGRRASRMLATGILATGILGAGILGAGVLIIGILVTEILVAGGLAVCIATRAWHTVATGCLPPRPAGPVTRPTRSPRTRLRHSPTSPIR
jgi:hypothetical protein